MSAGLEFLDFKRLFKSYNRGRKRKLRTSDKKTLEFLIKTQFNLFQLQKALEAGSYGAPGSLKNGAALVVEPLDVTMKLVTFDDKKIKLHKKLRKSKRRKNGK